MRPILIFGLVYSAHRFENLIFMGIQLVVCCTSSVASFVAPLCLVGLGKGAGEYSKVNCDVGLS